MLDFFKKAAKVYLNVFFWLFMIGDIFTGIELGQIVHTWSNFTLLGNRQEDYTAGILTGIFSTIISWIVTVLIFSLIGSFIALVDDVSAIRRKIEGGEINNATPIQTKANNASPSRFWDCPKCGQSNPTSNLYCIQCGNQKPKPVEAPQPNGARFWICPDCGSYNPFTVTNCENCNTPKPAITPQPVATSQPVTNSQPVATSQTGSSRFWVCPDCGSYNPLTVTNCENCNTPKP